MKATQAQKKLIKKSLATLDKGRLLEGLGRTNARSGGLRMIGQALEEHGFHLQMIGMPFSGDQGSKVLRVECGEEEVENMGVSYAWHWMGSSYEIIAYIS